MESTYAALARLYHGWVTGLILMVVMQRGAGPAAELVFRLFRRQQREKFLPGLAKLGLSGLPDAVASARYTKQTVDEQDALEGYFCEYDRALAPEERLRFSPGESAPLFDPAAAPTLPDGEWSPGRLAKARRNYAIEYVLSALPELYALFGATTADALAGRAALHPLPRAGARPLSFRPGMPTTTEPSASMRSRTRPWPSSTSSTPIMVPGGGCRQGRHVHRPGVRHPGGEAADEIGAMIVDTTR